MLYPLCWLAGGRRRPRPTAASRARIIAPPTASAAYCLRRPPLAYCMRPAGGAIIIIRARAGAAVFFKKNYDYTVGSY